MSAGRKGLLWWFRWPADPHVCLSFAVEFGPARSYLARLREARGPGITVNVLLAATIGRLLREGCDENPWVKAGTGSRGTVTFASADGRPQAPSHS